MSSEQPSPDFTWDTDAIIQGQADFLLESGECDDANQAFEQACQDSYLLGIEWQDLTDALTERLQRFNPGGYWHGEVTQFGWRGTCGYAQFSADTGRAFLQSILPETDCMFKLFILNNEIRIQNFHHDSPTGREWYTLTCDRGECDVNQAA